MVALSKSPSQVADSLVVAQVVTALRGYDALAFQGVTVRSELGVVTLTGSVPNWYARSLAYQLAHRQPDVTRVVDAVSVGRASLRQLAR